MENRKRHILLAEDDPSLGFVIRENLENRGFVVTLCPDGEAALAAFRPGTFDACVLDVMMPHRDGFAVAAGIRQLDPWVPILFLTARSFQEDRLMGFRTGGDDYITKPFSMEELLLRLDVFLRRENRQTGYSAVELGRYRFDPTNLTLSLGDTARLLTAKEAAILHLFCQNRQRVLKREEILTAVWGDDDYFTGRSLDVFISRLRKYLQEDANLEIVNHHGVGFKLEIRSSQQ